MQALNKGTAVVKCSSLISKICFIFEIIEDSFSLQHSSSNPLLVKRVFLKGLCRYVNDQNQTKVLLQCNVVF